MFFIYVVIKNARDLCSCENECDVLVGRRQMDGNKKKQKEKRKEKLMMKLSLDQNIVLCSESFTLKDIGTN
jgi:hypothetical protein